MASTNTGRLPDQCIGRDAVSQSQYGPAHVGGPIVTGGGLIFIGSTDDRRLRAFEVKSGKEVWTYKLPASVYGTPLTYRGKSGKQYIAAVTTGGFWGDVPAASDEVTAFALP